MASAGLTGIEKVPREDDDNGRRSSIGSFQDGLYQQPDNRGQMAERLASLGLDNDTIRSSDGLETRFVVCLMMGLPDPSPCFALVKPLHGRLFWRMQEHFS